MEITYEVVLLETLVEYKGNSYKRNGYQDDSWSWYERVNGDFIWIDDYQHQLKEELEDEYQKLVNLC